MSEVGNRAARVNPEAGVEVLNPETLPARRGRPPNILQIAPDRPMEDRIRIINEYHDAARLCYAQSAMYVILCGFELHAARATIGHGEWEKWVEYNCPFTARTAYNYLQAAERKAKDIPNLKHVSDFALGKSPMLLSAPEREQLVETIKAATDGETARQLYLDLGIIKPPRTSPANGGNHHKETLAERLAKASRQMEMLQGPDQWNLIVKYLREFALQKKRYVYVEPGILEAGIESINECVRAIKKGAKLA